MASKSIDSIGGRWVRGSIVLERPRGRIGIASLGMNFAAQDFVSKTGARPFKSSASIVFEKSTL
jgi:hypothetical protein